MLVRIKGQTKNYPWGSKNLIPDYFGLPESTEPIAEIWFGTHPLGPSELVESKQLLSLASGRKLGFLVKFLAAARALSIQVHPNSDQAKAGFEKENSLAIALTASNRNYKDDSHKPEILVALTPFRALCGFRPVAQMIEIFSDFGQFDARFSKLSAELAQSLDIKQAFEQLLNTDLLLQNLGSADPEKLKNPDSKAALELLQELALIYPADSGALVATMLNFVELDPGEAIYLPAGNLHAYLSGLGLEAMASSDNVLRAGLTDKHVDAKELVAIGDFSELKSPKVIPIKLAEGLVEYPVAVDDFRVYRALVCAKNILADLDLPQPAIVLCTEGEVAIGTSLEEREVLRKADVVFVAEAKKISLSGSGTVFIVLGN